MNAKQDELERTLTQMCLKLDTYLEDKYGEKYPIHPNRLKRGKAASGNYDGLFSAGSKFTLGYGSNEGRGYIVDIDIVTLSWVNSEDEKAIIKDGINYLKSLLPEFFPNRKLEIKKDGNLYKIIGDFSLGLSEIN